MPVITIDDLGNTLYYEDTGVPPDAVALYTTLIIVHGTGFHGQIFRRLIPLAPKRNVRLVLVNRRDYPGSSPYTEEDLRKVRTDDPETHNDFAKARASEFARFIKTFIEKENIPKASSDWKRGGVVLMAWSSGNGYTLPLLAYIDMIPEETRQFIEPYFRSHIVFNAPRWVLGAPAPDVLKDASLSEEERVGAFNEWVSAYYTHKSVTSRNFSDLQLAQPNGEEPLRKSTIASMTPEEIQEMTHMSAVFKSEVAGRAAPPAIHAERIRRALFDDELAKYWPRTSVNVVWCENSTWVVVDTMWEFQKAREKADEKGIVGRPLRIIMMPGANHFPHWDEPEMTMKFFANVVDA
ncbi:hypothetical protein ACEPAH_3482 [Sanghuangporus vaninii]